jgi:hypothetical protein
MRRILSLAFGAIAALTGCALVSGLDKLQLGDCEGGACADAGTTDTGAGDSTAADGAQDARADAPMDTGAVPSVSCASATCTGGQVCCRSVTDAGAVFACAASCSAPIACDGPGDCLGALCCASNGKTACKGNCVGQEDEVCTQGGPTCGGNKSCLPAPAGANLPPGYHTCQ